DPKPGDLARISRADLFIYLGAGMEPWVPRFLKAAQSGLKAVEASRDLPLFENKENHGRHSQGEKHDADPHVWLDFSLSMRIVDAIGAAMAEKAPDLAPRFRAGADDYKSRLEILDRQFREGLSSCRRRQIVLGGHSAFSYLARRYGLEQVALYGINPNAEPTPRKLAEVIRAAKARNVRCIFFEELVNPKLADVLAAEAGVETLVLNDGANITREKRDQKISFIRLMEQNLSQLRRGLDCEPR
ncbi:MAG TPA: zinc ABC transporter substrate-binding protein, partial [Thermodesulfobacteriota bacterium]|nr:zinc ABC transporter substrate-binding protein [Thermodesulfobacteriota bacterium]